MVGYQPCYRYRAISASACYRKQDMRMTCVIAAALALFMEASAAQRHPASGLVVAVDLPHQAVVVSHETIPGYMDAMVMPFRVRSANALDGLQPGNKVAFTLVVER